MAIDRNTKYGKIAISQEAVASLSGEAAVECYGVIGLTEPSVSQAYLRELLNKDDYVKGVHARQSKNGYEVDLYLVVANGVKITEVIAEVQKRVAYLLKKAFGLQDIKVNVYLQHIAEMK